MKKQRVALAFRKLVLSLLLLFSLFWFFFALVSGSEAYGGGFRGILFNSPNALPWLILFGIVYVAWRWGRIGGSLLLLFGVFTLFMFDTWKDPIGFLLISFPFLLLGGVLLWSEAILKGS